MRGTGLPHPVPRQTRGNRDARFAAVLTLRGISCRHRGHLRSSLLAIFVRTVRTFIRRLVAWSSSRSGKGSGCPQIGLGGRL